MRGFGPSNAEIWKGLPRPHVDPDEGLTFGYARTHERPSDRAGQRSWRKRPDHFSLSSCIMNLVKYLYVQWAIDAGHGLRPMSAHPSVVRRPHPEAFPQA